MSGSDVASVLLPVVRWRAPREPVSLVVDPASIPLLQESSLVGRLQLEGTADVGPKEIVVHLTATCRTREICGRSLEEFEAEFSFPFTILIRRGKTVKHVAWDDESDETFEVDMPEDQRELDITEVLRQAIELERPLSPVKPGVELPEGVLPEDEATEAAQEEPIDPRWEALRKLKGS